MIIPYEEAYLELRNGRMRGVTTRHCARSRAREELVHLRAETTQVSGEDIVVVTEIEEQDATGEGRVADADLVRREREGEGTERAMIA
jgi:hypothetical protein